jgi:hypothetical protein
VRKETPWGVWDHLPLEEVSAIFAGFDRPWWIAGGFAIDAFAGSGRREHDDIDVGAFASDQLALQAHLQDWELQYADPPGTLNPWPHGFELPADVHDIWARGGPGDSWRFQLMLNPGGPAALVDRRDERVSLPLERALVPKDGVRFLAPEYQLLFKSRGRREKDERDFADCLPLLKGSQKAWLKRALELTDPLNPWLGRL